MSLLDRLFSSHKQVDNPVKWDMHNHILFGIDDGSKTIENSVAMAREFVSLGYRKIVATPHIMADYYPNTEPVIRERAVALNEALKAAGVDLSVDFAAEYYIDETLLEKVKNKENLLTFNGKHLLMETSFLNKPMFFNQLVFDLKTLGYTPVFAHPERYVYLHNQYEEVERLMEQGLKLQINLLSLLGYYSPMVKKLAHWMVKHGYYHYLGTDAHNIEHLKLLKEAFKSKIFNAIDFDKVENCRQEL
jgi:protein-tyrosine phosphatase